jgi:hypothetical protein
MMHRWLTRAALALGVAGCAPTYVYQPAQNATGQVQGRLAADYPIPTNNPQGDVRLASFGISTVSPQNAPDVKQRAIHVRLIIANNSGQYWSLDTREQRIDVPGAGQQPPAYVSTQEGDRGLPMISIAPNGKRTLDLFYPLPATMQSAKQIPEFDVLWRLNTGSEIVAERTPFDRLQIEPVYAYGYGWDYAPYAWGGPYWFDPWYPAGVLGPEFTVGSVVVGRPTWSGGEVVHVRP